MENGLYKVTFGTQMGDGAGVAVLNDGRILGGDSAIAYEGEYTQAGNDFKATVRTRRHTAGIPSVFGIDTVTINIVGKTDGNKATLKGSSPAAPGISFNASLELIAS